MTIFRGFALLLLALPYAGNALRAQAAPAVFDSLVRVQTDTVYFATGRWELDSNAMALLSAYPVPRAASHRIYLTGHTDAVGSETANELLARRRARTAADQLLARGWADSALLVQTFGERRPVAANDEETTRRRNRRVTIDYYEPLHFTNLRGRVIDPATGEGVAATLRLHNRRLDDTLRLPADGRFNLRVPIDSVIGIDVFATGYFYQSTFLRVKPSQMEPLTLELPAAASGAAMDIPNLYFIGNQAVPLPQSLPEFPKIKRFLEMNPNTAIEIAGHVNYPNQPPVTKSSWEWDLSVRRARMVYQWLIDNGIDPERLSYRGYGNHQMRFPNATTDEQQAQNRRVEIVVE